LEPVGPRSHVPLFSLDCKREGPLGRRPFLLSATKEKKGPSGRRALLCLSEDATAGFGKASHGQHESLGLGRQGGTGSRQRAVGRLCGSLPQRPSAVLVPVWVCPASAGVILLPYRVLQGRALSRGPALSSSRPGQEESSALDRASSYAILGATYATGKAWPRRTALTALGLRGSALAALWTIAHRRRCRPSFAPRGVGLDRA
jgi:hypothetical protein